MSENKKAKKVKTTKQDKVVAKVIKDRVDVKKAYFDSIGIFCASLFIFIVSLSFFYHAVFKYSPPPSFIVLNEDSRILEESPLTEHIISDAELTNIVNGWFHNIFSYNYLNIDEHGANIKHYFANDDAYADFMNVFSNLRLQARVRQLGAIVRPVVVEPIIISSTSIHRNQRRIYQMEGVYVLEIVTPQGSEVLRYRVNVIISRQRLVDNPNGYAIEVIALR